MALPRPPAHRLLVSGAALGPLLAGLLSPSGWTNVFYMLMFADACALLVSRPALIQAALRERLCGVGQRRATPLPVVSAALREVGPVTYPSVPKCPGPRLCWFWFKRMSEAGVGQSAVRSRGPDGREATSRSPWPWPWSCQLGACPWRVSHAWARLSDSRHTRPQTSGPTPRAGR